MYICAYIFIYVSICTYVYIYLYMYIYTHRFIYVMPTHICACILMYTYMCTKSVRRCTLHDGRNLLSCYFSVTFCVARALSLSLSLSLTHTHTQTLTHTLTHTHTHTHTHTPGCAKMWCRRRSTTSLHSAPAKKALGSPVAPSTASSPASCARWVSVYSMCVYVRQLLPPRHRWFHVSGVSLYILCIHVGVCLYISYIHWIHT